MTIQNGTIRQVRRMIMIGIVLPEFGGGGRFVEILGSALEDEGITVEYWALKAGPAGFPRNARIRHIFKNYRLLLEPAYRGGTSLGDSLGRTIKKGIISRTWRISIRRLLKKCDRRDVVVCTVPLVGTFIEDSGYFKHTAPERRPLMIGQYHSSFSILDEGDIQALRHSYRSFDAFVALTDEDAASFSRVLDIPVVSIPNPVGPQPDYIQHPDSDPTRKAVALARYSPEKQLTLMVRAFAAAVQLTPVPWWELHIYGSGPELERTRLQAQIVESGVDDRTFLHTHTMDIESVLASADILLSTSAFEGLPISVIEAAAAGVPTLGFDCSVGMRTLLTSGMGWLVPNQDELEFARSLSIHMRDVRGLASQSLEARRAAAAFDSKVIASRWIRRVEGLAAQKSGSLNV